jgi:LysM domain
MRLQECASFLAGAEISQSRKPPMKISTELGTLAPPYNSDALSARRAVSQIDFQQLMKSAAPQRAPAPALATTGDTSRMAAAQTMLPPLWPQPMLQSRLQPQPQPQSQLQSQLQPQPQPQPQPQSKLQSRLQPQPQPLPQTLRPYIAQENTVSVKAGDTLVGIAQKALQARGMDASPQAAMRTALQLARENGLPDANLITPGQKINVNSLTGATPALPLVAMRLAREVLTDANKASPSNFRVVAQPVPAKPSQVAHPILEKTLARAVSLQYFSESEKAAVRSKVLDLAAEHRFSPDDLAVVTLLESDGMNPKASNGRCHGVIQFCDGPNRGAASVGYKDNPKAILDMTLLDQLDLVGKYFDETGLKSFGKSKPASLDDLYLTVLTPAARRERDINATLDIAGQQANVLKTGGEPNAPITRATLLEGLRQNSRRKLSMASPAVNPAGSPAGNPAVNPAVNSAINPAVNSAINPVGTHSSNTLQPEPYRPGTDQGQRRQRQG